MLKVLNYLKALAALLGSIATALLQVYTDNEVLVIIAIVATAITTWAVPNLDVAEPSVVVYDSNRGDDPDAYDDEYGDLLETHEGEDLTLPVESIHGSDDRGVVASAADVIGQENMPADDGSR